MIIGFGGKLSSGKTVTGVRFAYDEGKRGKKVIANIKLNFPKSIKTVYLSNDDTVQFIDKNMDNPEGLMSMFYNSVWLIDEVTNLFNARKSTSLLNDLVTSFIMMVGKLDCDIVFTYQVRHSQVDLRLREISNIHANCYRIYENGQPVLFGKRVLNKKIYILLAFLLDLDLYGSRITYERYDPEPYFQLYDTREIVLMDRSKYKKELSKTKKTKYALRF